jgi:hypothetical protein
MNSKYKIIVPLISVAGAVYLIFLMFQNSADAQNVSVTATVPTSVTCSLSTTTTAFGNIDPSSVFTSSPNVTTTVSCNPAAGCEVKINDVGSSTAPGLWNSSASFLIPSPNAAFNATATLVAGTKGYGIQATTTANGSGATLNLVSKYIQSGTTVAGLTTSTQQLASSSSPTANREIVVTHKSAVDGLTPAGSYADTITYTCVSN